MTQFGGRKRFNYDTQQYEADPNYPINQASILESRALNLLNITPSTINNSSFINTQYYNLDDHDKLKVIDLYNKAIKKRDFLDKKFKDQGHLYYNKKLKTEVNSLASIKKHSTPKSGKTRKIYEPSVPSVSQRHKRQSSRAIGQVTRRLSFDENDEHHDEHHDMGNDFYQSPSLDEVVECISTMNIMGGRKKNKKTKKSKNGGTNRRRSRSRAPARETSITPQSRRRSRSRSRRRSRSRSRSRSRRRPTTGSRRRSRSRAVSRSPDNQCSICFEHLSKNNKNAFFIDGCNHIFHNNCITPWLDKNTCPNCRKTIDTNRPVRIINSLLANEPSLSDSD